MKPLQPLYLDEDGVIRFRANTLVQRLLDHGTETGLSLNDLAWELDHSDEDWEQFAQLIGYSLDGFGSLSYVSEEAWEAAHAAFDAQARD